MQKILHHFDTDVSWEIISSPVRLEQICRELADQKVFAWDVETSGRSVWHGSRIVGHGFAWRRASGLPQAVYLPIRHRSMETELFSDCLQLDSDMVTNAVRPILEGSACKIGHNLKFDIHHAAADNIQVTPPYADTFAACRLIDESWRNYQLETCLALARLPHEVGWKKSIRPQINDRAKRMKVSPKHWVSTYGYQYLTIPVLGRYCCQDACYELFLGEWALPQQARWQSIFNLEMDLISVILEMESKGVPLDVDRLWEINKKEYANMDDLESQIFGMAKTEWELTNDGQTRDILYNRLNLIPPSYTDSGLPSVDDDALFHLSKSGHAIADLLRKWNISQKVVSTYTGGLIEKVDAYGVLHTELDSLGARTGRVASRSPNLQNIPIRSKTGRQIREAFICRKNMIRYCLDYSQIELRVLAHLSQDPLLLKIYREGLDAHKISAIEAFGTAEVVGGIDMRRIAKILNFGVAFGMTSKGLVTNTNKDLPDGCKPITEDQGQNFIDRFYQKYQGVSSFKKRLCYQVAANPEHEFFNMFGRPRRVREGFNLDDPKWKRSAAERFVISTMVQGSTADLVKHSMVKVWQFLKNQKDCEAYMVLMIHDDLQFDMGFEGSAACVREIKRIMEQTCQNKMSVPIIADVEYFLDNWGNKKKMKGI